MVKQHFYLQTNSIKKSILLIVMLLLVITPVTPFAFEPLAMSFVKSSVMKALPPQVAQTYTYLIDPTGTLKGEVLGQLQKVAPQLTEGLTIAANPDEALKSKLLGEVAKKAEEISPGVLNTVENIQQYASYAQEVMQPNEKAKEGEEYGKFDCDKSTKRCLILNPDGTKLMDVPQDFKLKFNEEDKSLTITNDQDKVDNLKIGDFNVGSLHKGSSVKFMTEKDGGAKIKVDGQSDVLIGEKTFFSGVSNAEFKVSKTKEGKFNQIEFADFVSTNPSQYGFSYTFPSGNKNTYNFKTTKPNSKVTFNPKKDASGPGFLDAENAIFNFGDQTLNGDKVTMTFNDNGNMGSVIITGKGAKYFDRKRNIEVGSVGGDPIQIFFNVKKRSIHSSVTLIETSDGVTISSSMGGSYYKLNNMKITDAGAVEDSTTLFYDKKKKQGFLNCKVACDVAKGDLEYSLDRNPDGQMEVAMTRESLKKKRTTDNDKLFLELENGKFAELDNKGDFFVKTINGEGEIKTFDDKSLEERMQSAQINAKENAFGAVKNQKELGLTTEAKTLAGLSKVRIKNCSLLAGDKSKPKSENDPVKNLEGVQVDESQFGSLDCVAGRPRKNISKIILHDASVDGAQSLVIMWLSGSKASSHYFIDKNGVIFPLMDERLVAGHAGCSQFKTDEKTGEVKVNIACISPNTNFISIGIDLQSVNGLNPEDSKQNWYTDAQLKSLRILLSDITNRNGIPYDDEHIEGHFQVYAGHGDPMMNQYCPKGHWVGGKIGCKPWYNYKTNFDWAAIGLNPDAHQIRTADYLKLQAQQAGLFDKALALNEAKSKLPARA